MKTGIELIAEERQRQIEQEGYSNKHDDAHDIGEMAIAAGGYIAYVTGFLSKTEVPPTWPWRIKDWKPSEDNRRNLVKAGALIAAEIDRLNRLPAKPA